MWLFVDHCFIFLCSVLIFFSPFTESPCFTDSVNESVHKTSCFVQSFVHEINQQVIFLVLVSMHMASGYYVQLVYFLCLVIVFRDHDFFNFYLAVSQPILGNSRGNNVAHLMLITTFFYNFDPKVARGLVTNKAGPLSPVELLVGFEWGSFQFCLQYLPCQSTIFVLQHHYSNLTFFWRNYDSK